MARALLLLLALALAGAASFAAATPQDPQVDPRLLRVDRQKREVRVRCQALRVDMPLEFFCVLTGTADHETVLRTVVRPSAVHAALLGLGLEPGHPLRFVPERKEWIAPSGPPLRIDVEWEENGKTVRRRAGELMRNMKTGEVMPQRHWVFSGSALGPAGEYGADVTGQLVSIVNFEYTTIDVPRIASNANETLEWEVNAEMMPPDGTEVWMIITPIEAPATRATQPLPRAAGPDAGPVDVVVVKLDEAGGVMVNNQEVALAEAGQLVRAQAGGASTVRLTAPRGAPVDVLGRLLGELVRHEITNVTFVVPPAPATPAPAPNTPVPQPLPPGEITSIEVHDGGREVSIAGTRTALGTFVQQLRERSDGPRGREGAAYVIRPAADATDLKPVDFAAVHAALYVLGFEVRVDAPQYGPATRPGAAAPAHDMKLAELRQRWEQQVLPQAGSLQRAAQTHYEMMEAYQDEINRLLDEVERLRQEMDALQQRYSELTAPKPGSR